MQIKSLRGQRSVSWGVADVSFPCQRFFQRDKRCSIALYQRPTCKLSFLKKQTNHTRWNINKSLDTQTTILGWSQSHRSYLQSWFPFLIYISSIRMRETKVLVFSWSLRGKCLSTSGATSFPVDWWLSSVGSASGWVIALVNIHCRQNFPSSSLWQSDIS